MALQSLLWCHTGAVSSPKERMLRSLLLLPVQRASKKLGCHHGRLLRRFLLTKLTQAKLYIHKIGQGCPYEFHRLHTRILEGRPSRTDSSGLGNVSLVHPFLCLGALDILEMAS